MYHAKKIVSNFSLKLVAILSTIIAREKSRRSLFQFTSLLKPVVGKFNIS